MASRLSNRPNPGRLAAPDLHSGYEYNDYGGGSVNMEIKNHSVSLQERRETCIYVSPDSSGGPPSHQLSSEGYNFLGDKYYLQNRLGFETLTAHRHQRSVVGPHNACVGQSVAPEHIIHGDRQITDFVSGPEHS
ncbi:hypothetical protein NQZ68_013160 [Dissostichus eleginoides]|nr:hypothetical protein NQZ68_013160 [Dissostichus eleginoides]